MVGKKLSNERFVANAKPEVVQKERDKQADYQGKYDATVARIDEMKKLVKLTQKHGDEPCFFGIISIITVDMLFQK